MFDFANILFAGPCNARCPFCIGKQIDSRLSVNNLNEFPPRNIEGFVAQVLAHDIKQIVFTGTTTDPQLYKHEAELLTYLRERLPARQFSVHTNGQLALKKIETLNLYDRVCLSLPTFNAQTYYAMMGLKRVPDLGELMKQVKIPVKVSCVINEHNINEIPEFLERCWRLGIRRLVFRQLYQDARQWNVTRGLNVKGEYRGNTVYDYKGMEVTYWDFDSAENTSINLFSSGYIGTSYLLAKTKSGDKTLLAQDF
jgi:MoaA/NifB/PqqE/SkfB family radical SAM enzyme